MEDYARGYGDKELIRNKRRIWAKHSSGFLIDVEVFLKEMTDGTNAPKMIMYNKTVAI